MEYTGKDYWKLKNGKFYKKNDFSFSKKSRLEMKARMDDPLDAVPVHFGGGVLGVICGPIFKVCLGIFFPKYMTYLVILCKA